MKQQLTQQERTRLAKASKFLLDNHEFNVVYMYCEDTLIKALTEGIDENAVSNLKNVRALRMFKQLMENLADG